MARREYCNTRQHFKIPFLSQPHDIPPPPSSSQLISPLLPIDIVTRCVQSMKRFFSTTTSKDANDRDGNPSKRQRYQHTNFIPQQTDMHDMEPDRTSDDFFVPPQRSRRNGIVFEDITLSSQNLAKSNTLPNRKTVINLSDIDFTKPPPEWMAAAFVETARDQRFSSMDVRIPVIPKEPATFRKADCAAKMIDFVSNQEFRSLQETITSSLSALPTRPGFLQETLFNHIMTSLSTLINSAEEGLRLSWGQSSRVCLPSHFIDAIVFMTAACKLLAKALTAEPPEAGDIADLGKSFVEVVKLVVQTANVIDALDLFNLMRDSTREKCATQLTRALEIIITASTRFTLDVEATLEVLAEELNASVPAILLQARFHVHQAIIDHHLRTAIYRLITESVVFKSALNKLDRLCPIAKRVGKQLDRIAAEEHVSNDTYRKILQNIDIRRDLLKQFFDAISTNSSKASFMSFRIASDLAKLAGEKQVQGECLYRMSNILITRGKSYCGITPNGLLITARALNSSEVFQAKVQSSLTSFRRRTISSLLDIAEAVNREYDLAGFIEGVRLFIHMLLAKYPSQGVDANNVLQGDVVKGMLKIIRIFHPDKNSFADEEARWICEEVTKVPLCVSFRSLDRF